MVQRANPVHKDQEANLGQVETKARRESKDQMGSQETKVRRVCQEQREKMD